MSRLLEWRLVVRARGKLREEVTLDIAVSPLDRIALLDTSTRTRSARRLQAPGGRSRRD